MTAGQLAQAVQGSAYPERYDERKGEAAAVLHAFNKGGLKPAQARKLKRVKARASELGLKTPESKKAQFSKAVTQELRLVKHGEYSKGPGKLVVDSGVSIKQGHEPEIAARLKLLSAKIGKPVYIISAYRSPQHSVEVGGFSNDPHTEGKAADIGIGSASRASAGSISESVYNSVGLHRPYYPESAAEINHVELLNGGTPSTGGAATGGAGVSGSAISAYASATGTSPKAVRARLGNHKLTPMQIYRKLEALGIVNSPKSKEPTKPKTTLAELEAKYGTNKA
jgi:hypothetical protein